MKKVFLGIKDKNTIFANRFLEAYDNSYYLTIGYIPYIQKLDYLNTINIQFINDKFVKNKDKVKYFKEIIKGYDLVVSNNIPALTTAAYILRIKVIQYSDLFMYDMRAFDSLYQKTTKSQLIKTNLNEEEKKAFALSDFNYILNPLYFFYKFSYKNDQLRVLKPYFKHGNPIQENENLNISIYAKKRSILNGKNLALINDFGYKQNNLIDQSYYDLISSSQNIQITADHSLIGDCLFNRNRPIMILEDKTTNNYFLYNFARTLNLSKTIEKEPLIQILDENKYRTLDIEVKTLLEIK